LKNNCLFFFFCLCSLVTFAQKARVKGVILDEMQNPIEQVTVKGLDKVVFTNANGFYTLEIPAQQKVMLVFSHPTFKNSSVTVELKPNEDFELNPVLSTKIEQMGELVITSDSNEYFRRCSP